MIARSTGTGTTTSTASPLALPAPGTQRARSGAWAAVAAAAAAAAAATAGAVGCLFLPAIDEQGYVPCTADGDCAPGFFCAADVGRCAPPEWNDRAFASRRVLLVDNPGAHTLPVGTAVPITVGGPRGLLALDDVAADARFTHFADGLWRVVGVYRDLQADRFTVWLPLQAPLAPGGRAALAWLEQGTAAGAPTVLENTGALPFFDDLLRLDSPALLVVAPGGDPVQTGSGFNVRSNQKLVWRTDLKPPVSVTFIARVNGLTCQQVFLGFTGAQSASFEPPSAGFFIDTDLLTVAEYAPTASAGVFETLDAPRIFAEQPNATHRFTVAVDPDGLKLLVDDDVFGERSGLRPAFDDVPFFPTVAVGGGSACSVDVDAVWVTTSGVQAPVVTAGPTIVLDLAF